MRGLLPVPRECYHIHKKASTGSSMWIEWVWADKLCVVILFLRQVHNAIFLKTDPASRRCVAKVLLGISTGVTVPLIVSVVALKQSGLLLRRPSRRTPTGSYKNGSSSDGDCISGATQPRAPLASLCKQPQILQPSSAHSRRMASWSSTSLISHCQRRNEQTL